MAVHHRTERETDGYHQRNAAQVESEAPTQPHDRGVRPRHELPERPRGQERCDEQREHAPQDEQELMGERACDCISTRGNTAGIATAATRLLIIV